MINLSPSLQELKKESYSQLVDENFKNTLFEKRKAYFFIKRCLDFLLSLFLLIFLAPLWLVIILFIKKDSPGKAIFSHQRAGKNGQPFTLYKFRTMHEGVKDQELAPTSKNDPRITKIGKWLRRTSLDEMPQLWNVLKGDMSLVGPRPEMIFITDHYTALEKCRLLIKPGITGLWQINGRKDLPLHENIEYDFYYLLHQSFFLDVIILLKTIKVVINAKGAY